MAARTGTRTPMPPDSLNDDNYHQQSFGNQGRTPNNSSGGGAGKVIIIVFISLLLLGGTVVAVFALDVGGARSSVMGYLQNAPLIGSMFEEQETDPLYEMTEDEMRLAIHIYRDQIASLENQRNELNAQLATANLRIAHLLSFETRWQEYREASALFTQILAHNDPINFMEFFQDIVDHDLVPQDILAAAFAEAQAINVFYEELHALVRTYNSMEAGRAAEDLERLMLTNTDLAVLLLRAMSSLRRGEIFDEMEYTVSSTFAILLSLALPTFTPLVPPPYLPEILPMATPTAVVPIEQIIDEYDVEAEEPDTDANGEVEESEPDEEE